VCVCVCVCVVCVCVCVVCMCVWCVRARVCACGSVGCCEAVEGKVRRDGRRTARDPKEGGRKRRHSMADWMVNVDGRADATQSRGVGGPTASNTQPPARCTAHRRPLQSTNSRTHSYTRALTQHSTRTHANTRTPTQTRTHTHPASPLLSAAVRLFAVVLSTPARPPTYLSVAQVVHSAARVCQRLLQAARGVDAAAVQLPVLRPEQTASGQDVVRCQQPVSHDAGVGGGAVELQQRRHRSRRF
jgi:hypothetical protein